jgi:tRNA-dihydrouridine synthase B
MKQFASWFTHGIPGGSTLRKAIFEAKNGTAVLDSVEAFFAGDLRPASVEASTEAEAEMLGDINTGCDTACEPAVL